MAFYSFYMANWWKHDAEISSFTFLRKIDVNITLKCRASIGTLFIHTHWFNTCTHKQQQQRLQYTGEKLILETRANIFLLFIAHADHIYSIPKHPSECEMCLS